MLLKFGDLLKKGMYFFRILLGVIGSRAWPSRAKKDANRPPAGRDLVLYPARDVKRRDPSDASQDAVNTKVLMRCHEIENLKKIDHHEKGFFFATGQIKKQPMNRAVLEACSRRL